MRFTIFVLLAIITLGCSQFSNAPTARLWHNTNARFNKLIIARNNLKETEENIKTNRREEYSAPLPVIFPIDSLEARSSESQLKEVISKASIIAEKHSNSKYLDDAYLMLGRARMLKGDYLNAIEIFKYVNTKSNRSFEKGQALLQLMHCYIENNDYEAGLRVGEALRDASISKKQTIQYYLTKAYLHQRREELVTAGSLLDEATKLMKRGQLKARTHFIAGQMYEALGQDDKSAGHFAQVAKNRPAYDLEFYAKMNALQNETNESESRKQQILGQFETMLEDRKNDDLKDKIYFTMGQVERKSKNYKKAETYYKKAVESTKGNKLQASISYLELAKLNYEHLLNYEKSQAYYDSALAFLPETSPEFENIRKHTKVLNEFVKYQQVIKREDSLQKITDMNPARLDLYLEESIKKIDEEEQKLLEKARQIAINNRNKNNGGGFNRWLLYDPIKIAQSKLEFQQIWGNRPLEDNWRRATKENGTISGRADKLKIDPNAKIEDENAGIVLNSSNKMPLELRKKAMLSELPLSPEAKLKSNKALEDALYKVAKIYYLNLNEPENAKKYFRDLLNRYPATSHEPEVLYLLVLLGSEDALKTRLIAKYPNTSFARLIQKGDGGPVGQDLEIEAMKAYEGLFESFKNQDAESALKLAERSLIQYTGTKIEDKIAIIRIYILSKLAKKEEYIVSITDFLQSYPSSDLTKTVKELQKAIEGK